MFFPNQGDRQWLYPCSPGVFLKHLFLVGGGVLKSRKFQMNHFSNLNISLKEVQRIMKIL
jgi:hypothetical protein